MRMAPTFFYHTRTHLVLGVAWDIGSHSKNHAFILASKVSFTAHPAFPRYKAFLAVDAANTNIKAGWLPRPGRRPGTQE